MKKRDRAWLPADYSLQDVAALKALAEGIASEGQQKRALAWIVRKAAEHGEIAFRSNEDGGDRETTFALGRQFVGQQIMKLVDMHPEIMERLKKHGDGSDRRDPDRHDR